MLVRDAEIVLAENRPEGHAMHVASRNTRDEPTIPGWIDFLLWHGPRRTTANAGLRRPGLIVYVLMSTVAFLRLRSWNQNCLRMTTDQHMDG